HERLDAELLARALHQRDLRIGIGAEAIDGNDGYDAEFLHVLDMAREIGDAGAERLEVLALEVLLLDPAVHLERADGRDEDRAVRRKAGFAALDVEELLATEIGAESRFGHDIIAELERGSGGQHGIAAVGDVGKWPAVYEGGRAFERLHQVGRERLLEQRGHGALGLELAGAHRFAIARIAN